MAEMEKQNWEPEIGIIDLRFFNGTSALRGFADVRIGEIVTLGWRILRRPDGTFYTDLPQVSRRGPDGLVKYFPALSLPGWLRQKVDLLLLSSWEKRLRQDDKHPAR